MLQVNQTHFPPSYPISQDWSGPRDPQQIFVHRPPEPQSLKAGTLHPLEENSLWNCPSCSCRWCHKLPPAGAEGRPSCFWGISASQGSVWVILLLFQVLGVSYSHTYCRALRRWDPAAIPGFSHPAASPELSLLSHPCLLEGLVHPLAPAGNSGMPRAGDFCCHGGF